MNRRGDNNAVALAHAQSHHTDTQPVSNRRWPPPKRQRSGQIIAVGNLKDGTGKSTLSVNLAGQLAQEGHKVCIADCDPQGTSAQWLATGEIKVVVETVPVNAVGEVAGWIQKATELAGRFDIVLVDLPSVLSPALASAFLMAHVILVPVSPSSVDRYGTARVMRYIRAVREERVDAKPQVMLVPTRVPEDQLARDTLQSVFAEFHEKVGPPLRERRCFHEAFTARSWVGQTAPQEAGHADISVLAAAVSELLANAPPPPLLAKPPAIHLTPAFNEQELAAKPVANDAAPLAKPSWFKRVISLLK